MQYLGLLAYLNEMKSISVLKDQQEMSISI